VDDGLLLEGRGEAMSVDVDELLELAVVFGLNEEELLGVDVGFGLGGVKGRSLLARP
jgi:hypothetical protein